MRQDFSHALRTLLHAPGFTAAALLTLALAIGATTIVFSFVNGLILRPLPFGKATSRIVSIHGTHASQFPDHWDDARISYADLQDVRRQSRLLDDAGGFFERSFTLGGDEAVRVSGASVTPNLFSLLGVRPARGRLFRPDEGTSPGFETVVLVSDALWRARFGADPDLLGKTIRLNERELEVVGILPPRFRYPERQDLWLPYDPGEGSNRAARGLIGVGQLREGVGLDELRQELDAIASRLEHLYPEMNRGWSIHALAYRDLLVRPVMRLVAASALGAVGLVLLIGCANLASLLFARGTARQRELAVRAALGAGRGRLVRQLLVESFVLGAAGGALGTLLALWGLDAIVASFPEELPYWLRFDLDGRAAVFVVALSLFTSIAFGLIPALRASKLDLVSALGGGRDPEAAKGALGAQGALIVLQVALSLALLVGAGLMIRSASNLSAADPGFDEDHLLTLRVYLSGDAYDPTEKKVAFFRDAIARLREVPGVVDAAATTSLPSDDGGTAARLVSPEHPVADGTELGVQLVGAMPGFLRTLGVSLIEGRPFAERDVSPQAAPVAIVNRRLAARLWPGVRAYGREIGLVTNGRITWFRVIGVAPHIQYEEFGEETLQSSLNVFVPYSRLPYRSMVLLVRSEGDPGALGAPAREALRSFAPGLPIYALRTMVEVHYLTMWEQRFFSHLFDVFAAAAVFLACLGIYGLLAHSIGQRTHEIGIRMALGAAGRDVLRLVLRRAVGLGALGLLAGVPVAIGVAHVLESALYGGTSSSTLLLYAGAALVLVVPILLASYLPARRAAGIPPMAALRDE